MIQIKQRKLTHTAVILALIDGNYRPIKLIHSDPFTTLEGQVVQARTIKADKTKGNIFFKLQDTLDIEVEQAKEFGITVVVEPPTEEQVQVPVTSQV